MPTAPMTRYKVESVDPYDMEPSPDGMWVMFDDVQAAIAVAVTAERERCAALCSKAMPQPVANWADAQIVEALRLVREAILSTEAKP